jgi:starch synthase
MQPLKICLLSAEVTPFAKTGGLADVAASLARHLARKKHDVRLVMPLYKRVREGGYALAPVAGLQDVPVRMGERTFYVSVSTAKLAKSPVRAMFVRCPELFERDGIYTEDRDEPVRFALLSQAALVIAQWTQWAPDVVHCNDWHTALVPLYLRTVFAWDRLFARTKTVLTIHNIGYQGVFSSEHVGALGLANETRFLYQEDLHEHRINFLKTGILYADAITTVSRTYAREIQETDLGLGLQGLLRRRHDAVLGIVNGVDAEEWNPRRDTRIPFRYSPSDLRGKERSKQAFHEKHGLDFEARAPLAGIVSRLTAQKGLELLPDILPVLLHREGLRLAVLGSGEDRYESYFAWLQGAFPRRVVYRSHFDDVLAHQIEAASDLFLMPSRYEPCGLNQMYSLRYGTVPVVRRTGGLADTVEPWDPATRTGTGFLFDDFSSDALYRAILDALATYRDESAWQQLMLNGMSKDFSWEHQIEEYVALYRRLVPPA